MEPTLSRPTWKRRALLILANVLAVAVTVPTCFMIFIMGAFASDSGTSAALTISFALIGVTGLYAIGTIALIVLSQVRNSLKLTLIPLVVSMLFIFFTYFA